MPQHYFKCNLDAFYLALVYKMNKQLRTKWDSGMFIRQGWANWVLGVDEIIFIDDRKTIK